MSVPAAALGAAISIYSAKVAYDAYEYYRDQVTETADESLARANELWRLDKKLKEMVPEGCEWLAQIPSYEECEDVILRSSVAGRSETIRNARATATMAGARGQIGMRRRLAREASLNLTRQTGVTASFAMQVEKNIEQLYADMKDRSVLDDLSVGGSYSGVANASRSSGALFGNLAAGQSSAFNASLSGLGVSLGQVFTGLNGSNDSAPTGASGLPNTYGDPALSDPNYI